MGVFFNNISVPHNTHFYMKRAKKKRAGMADASV